MTVYGWWPTQAARFREWRVNRVSYILVFLVAVIPWILQWQASHAPHQLVGMSFPSLAGEYIGGDASSQAVAALLLALVVVWNDWARGRLSYVLEGPISRQDVVLAKLWWCGLSVVGGGLAAALIVVVGSLVLHQPILLGGVLASLGLILAARLAMVATGLAVSGAVGNLLYLALSAWILAEWPSLFGSVSAFVASMAGGGNVGEILGPRWFWVANRGIRHFEPLSLTSTWHSGSWADLIGYVTWAVLLTVLALRWWTRASYERFHDPFYFPQLWNGVYAFWAALTATLVMETSSGVSPPTLTSLIVWVLTFIVGFFFWRGVMSYWGLWGATRSRVGRKIHTK